MSNLKNLNNLLQKVNEKKDPILNMYLGDLVHADIVKIDEINEYYIEGYVRNGKARVSTEALGSKDLFGREKSNIIIKRITKGKELESISYDPYFGLATATSTVKEDEYVERRKTVIQRQGELITELLSNTEVYTYDKLAVLEQGAPLKEEPVQVINALCNAKKEVLADIVPYYLDSFSSKLDGTTNITTVKDNKFERSETTAYSEYPAEESVLAAYEEYKMGGLRSASLTVPKTTKLR